MTLLVKFSESNKEFKMVQELGLSSFVLATNEFAILF